MPQKSYYIATLEDLGLSAHEASVYLASLSLGPSSVQKIAAEAGLKRTTVYSVLETLQRRGLMTVEVRGFKRLFAAEAPRKLERVLADRQARFEEILPDLEGLANVGGRDSFIRHYQGIEGIKIAYDGMVADVKRNEDYLVLSNYDHWIKLAPDFFADFVERRAKTGAKVKMLLVDTRIARERKELALRLGEEVRFLPPGIKLVTNLVVIPKKALLHQLIPPVLAVEIANSSVVQMHQEMYRLLWNQSRE